MKPADECDYGDQAEIEAYYKWLIAWQPPEPIETPVLPPYHRMSKRALIREFQELMNECEEVPLGLIIALEHLDIDPRIL